MTLPLLLTVPWLAVLGFVLFVVKPPRPLPARPRDGGAAPPRVSVIVPARNEAVTLRRCLAGLTASDYPDFEIIVVDDRSEDGTGDIARSIAPGRASRLQVVDGAALPEGWFGKPWACAQGADRAEGDLLLFTDADTMHGPELLAKAVAAMEEDGADLTTLLGRQLMETFWERVVQPHIFLMMVFRYPDFERVARSGGWRGAIANGQFMLFRRSAYEGIGGHAAVHDRVAEDQSLAQLVKKRGLVMSVRSAEDDFATRMYRSLGEIVRGWGKNIVLGGRASLPSGWGWMMVPGVVVTGVALWLVPVCVLSYVLFGMTPADGASGVGGMGGGDGAGLLIWSVGAVLSSAATWVAFTKQMRAPALYGLFYPIGVVVSLFIVLRAGWRGSRVEWKGRRYSVDERAGEVSRDGRSGA